jgi:hypothetical protein
LVDGLGPLICTDRAKKLPQVKALKGRSSFSQGSLFSGSLIFCTPAPRLLKGSQRAVVFVIRGTGVCDFMTRKTIKNCPLLTSTSLIMEIIESHQSAVQTIGPRARGLLTSTPVSEQGILSFFGGGVFFGGKRQGAPCLYNLFVDGREGRP